MKQINGPFGLQILTRSEKHCVSVCIIFLFCVLANEYDFLIFIF